MKLTVTKEFLEISREIENRKLTLSQWREIESSDDFQTKNYCGGFDATEDEFTFSYYNPDGTEYWFQLSLSKIIEINNRVVTEIDIRNAK